MKLSTATLLLVLGLSPLTYGGPARLCYQTTVMPNTVVPSQINDVNHVIGTYAMKATPSVSTAGFFDGSKWSPLTTGVVGDALSVSDQLLVFLPGMNSKIWHTSLITPAGAVVIRLPDDMRFTSINSFGHMAGQTLRQPVTSGVFWASDNPTILNFGANTSVTGLNENDQIVGTIEGVGIYTWTPGAVSPRLLSDCDVGTTKGYGLNNFGKFVGSANGHAALWDDTGCHLIDPALENGRETFFSSINDNGQVVGNLIGASNATSDAFLSDTSGEALQTLDSLVCTPSALHLYQAIQINRSGPILATGKTGTAVHSYLLSPK